MRVQRSSGSRGNQTERRHNLNRRRRRPRGQADSRYRSVARRRRRDRARVEGEEGRLAQRSGRPDRNLQVDARGYRCSDAEARNSSRRWRRTLYRRQWPQTAADYLRTGGTRGNAGGWSTQNNRPSGCRFRGRRGR